MTISFSGAGVTFAELEAWHLARYGEDYAEGSPLREMALDFYDTVLLVLREAVAYADRITPREIHEIAAESLPLDTYSVAHLYAALAAWRVEEYATIEGPTSYEWRDSADDDKGTATTRNQWRALYTMTRQAVENLVADYKLDEYQEG